MQQQTIDSVLNIDIYDVISKHVTLKKKGGNYVGCCPFHNEKTSSFTVFQKTNTYKCFGCGEFGGSINFIMNHEKLNFVDAVRHLCHDHNIKFENRELTDAEKAENKDRDVITMANKLAADYFHKNLLAKENKAALDYMLGRFTQKEIDQWQIGYATDSWDAMYEWAKKHGIKIDGLIKADLLCEKNDKVFSFFKDRIMFPFHNKLGNIVGFTGRQLKEDKEQAKYKNTRENLLYNKSQVLYGYHLARKQIREKKNAYLVEGNPDVIRLHSIGVINTVGTCGTSLTKEHLAILKADTPHITIIGDSDNAGKRAIERSAKLILEAGMTCAVIPLPDEKDSEGNQVKHDPDSFFKTAEQFADFKKENKYDYIVNLGEKLTAKADNSTAKAETINEICLLISHINPDIASGYIDELGAMMKPRTKWEKKLNEIYNDRKKAIKEKEVQATEGETWKLPHGVNRDDYARYGFYEHKNKYFFDTGKGRIEGSNFTMRPLFHVESIINSKRLYEITNEFGYTRIIELNQEDLIALAKFKKRIESLGNFIWQTDEVNMTRLKRFLYEKTESCQEIIQLGWQKQGFFAWGNGISNGQFNTVDKYGIVRLHDKNYYLPAFSEIYQNEDTLFFSERKFTFKPAEITLLELSEKLINVFGNSATIGLCFYIGCLYKDIITRHFGFFPLLNLFGPKGAGKTEMAHSLLHFFGNLPKGPNINNTTKAALADHVAQTANAVCHIDEYKNSIEFEKIEFLKGLWDGTGRTRMNMDKDKKKETTSVECGIMISGQEMPTADIALYSRLVFLTFNQTEYNDAEKASYNELKKIEQRTYTHITHELLQHRDMIKAGYIDSYNTVMKDLLSKTSEHIIEDRVMRNWAVIIAAYHCIREKIQVSFSYSKLIDIAANGLVSQNKEMKKSNELSVFWKILEYLTRDGIVEDEIDFKVQYTTELKTDKFNIEQLDKPMNVLFLNHSRIFHLYRKHGKSSADSILPIKTLEYYLLNSKEYLGKKSSMAFKIKEMPGMNITTPGFDDEGKAVQIKKRQITTALCFKYDDLGINITNEDEKLF